MGIKVVATLTHRTPITEIENIASAETSLLLSHDAGQKAGDEAVAESAAAVADYRAGSERALNFIVGQVMKKTRGKASAGEVHRLVKEEVEKV